MNGSSILVVENEAIVALDLTERLSRLGYRVVATVAEGESALAAVIEHEPDLVLMDIRLMGAMDGIEASQQISQERDVPIVYLTAHSDPQTLAKACLTLPFGYILKPYTERELHTQLEIALYRHRAERQIRENEEKLRSVMDTAPDGIMAIDNDGVIVSSNPAAHEIFGYAEGEMTGRNAGILMPGLNPILVKDDPLWSLRTSGGKVLGAVREITGKRKDGTSIPIELAVSSKNGEQHGNYIGIVRDLSRRKRLENQLVQVVDDLREADRRKDEFLATLSHELRNPLAPIRNAATILTRVDLADPKLRWCCEIVDRQVGLMTRLLEDLLDVNRITRGTLILRKEWVDFREIVRNIVATCSADIEAAGHKLVLEVPDDDTRLYVDAVRLTQVLSNLVSNAGKYMDGKGVVRLAAMSEDGQFVVKVQDSGIGISAELLPHIFEMFRQAENNSERSRGGLGIGLALVKSLVDLHGGSVEAQSAGLGEGSVFTVRLPLMPVDAVQAETNAAAAKKASRPEPSKSKRLLVVDDNKLQAQSLGLLLELRGYQVRLAYDGPGALATLGEYSPDVALIDLGLPGMSGYELARHIREQMRSQNIMLIAQTGWGRDSDRLKSRQAGFNHHLTKPVDHQILEKILQETEPLSSSLSSLTA